MDCNHQQKSFAETMFLRAERCLFGAFSIFRYAFAKSFCVFLLLCFVLLPSASRADAVSSAEEGVIRYSPALQTVLFPSIKPACESVKVGLAEFYYDGTNGNFDRYEYTGTRNIWTCIDQQGQTYPVEGKCVVLDENGDTEKSLGDFCPREPECDPCHINEASESPDTGAGSPLIGNPTLLRTQVKVETAVDWVSPRDSRFRIFRNYRSDNAHVATSTIGCLLCGVNSFGKTWQDGYSEALWVDTNSTYKRWDGSRILLGPTNTGQTSQGLSHYTLTSTPGPYPQYSIWERGGVQRRFGGLSGLQVLQEIIWPDGYRILTERKPPGWGAYNPDSQEIISISDNKGQRVEYYFSASAVPNSNARVVTKISIDTDYDGVTFDPQLSLHYSYVENTIYSGHPTLVQVSLEDLAASTTEVIAAYEYLPLARPEPVLLTKIFDGRTDGQGNLLPYTTIEYDLSDDPWALVAGRVSSVSHPNGTDSFSFSRTMNATGSRPESVSFTNALGRKATYTFGLVDGLSRVISLSANSTNSGGSFLEATPRNASISYTPNPGAPEGFVYARTERNGSRTEFERNAQGLVTKKTEDANGAAPRITTYTWDPVLRLPLTRTTSERSESFTYTPKGLLTEYTQTDVLIGSPTNGQSRTWVYTYTTLASGLSVLTQIDGPGLVANGVNDVTMFAYDAKGALQSTTDPNGLTTTVNSVNANGQPTLITQPDGIQWGFTYDPRGRMLTSTLNPGTPNAATSSYTYDVIGQIVSSTNMLGQTMSFEYDGARRLVKATNAAGEEARFQYDLMGNMTRTEYANGSAPAAFWQESQYDELNRLVKTLGAAGQAWSFTHDVEDNLASLKDPLNYTSTNSYDALNRVTQVVDRAGHTTSMEHNQADQTTRYTDPRNIDTGFTYNGFGEVLSEVSADRGTRSYTYNTRGLVTSTTDPRGITSTYEYDQGGRLTARRFPATPSHDQTFTYDQTSGGTAPQGMGKLWQTTDASGSTKRTYDATTGDLAAEERVIANASYTIGYQTDVEGNLTSLTYPSGLVIAYARDSQNRVTGITANLGSGPQNVISGAAYRPNGPLAGFTYGDGGVFTASYDGSYRLTRLLDTHSGTTLRDITYGYDTRDNLTTVTDAVTPANGETYGYTPRELLASADGPWGDQAYSYDAVGNRLSMALTQGGSTTTDIYSYGTTDNRLLSVSGAQARAFTYDAAGNVTYDARSGVGYGYSYDPLGRMASFALDGVVQAEYGYNALGQQVSRRLTQQNQVIHAVHDVDGNRIAEYLYDPIAQSSTLMREYVWMDGQAVAVVEGGVLYFIRTDHIGRPVFATDSTGTKVWEAAYLPFGGVRTTVGTPISLRFPGQWYQAESGLHQNWMRDYDPTTGRYIQADPLGLVDGAAVYGYALQNPMRWTDPRGEYVHIVAGAIAGGIIGAYSAYSNYPCWQAAVIGGISGAAAGAAIAGAGLYWYGNATAGFGGAVSGQVFANMLGPEYCGCQEPILDQVTSFPFWYNNILGALVGGTAPGVAMKAAGWRFGAPPYFGLQGKVNRFKWTVEAAYDLALEISGNYLGNKISE